MPRWKEQYPSHGKVVSSSSFDYGGAWGNEKNRSKSERGAGGAWYLAVKFEQGNGARVVSLGDVILRDGEERVVKKKRERGTY